MLPCRSNSKNTRRRALRTLQSETVPQMVGFYSLGHSTPHMVVGAANAPLHMGVPNSPTKLGTVIAPCKVLDSVVNSPLIPLH
jgi:hypothetical protein